MPNNNPDVTPNKGLFAAYSTDHGDNWTPSNIAIQPGDIPAGNADPWAVFTDTGRLYISYLKDSGVDDGMTFGVALPLGVSPTIVAKSVDGGATFSFVAALGSIATDKPVMAVGPGEGGVGESLWVMYRQGGSPGRIAVAGTVLDAQGDPTVGACGAIFCAPQPAPSADTEKIIAFDGPKGVFPGGLAVGPNGQVLASYMRVSSAIESSEIFVVLDGDGLGSAMGFPTPPTPPAPPTAIPLVTSNVGFLEDVPPQSARGITAIPSLAWDRAGNRAYLVYTSEEPDGSGETDIMLLRSIDGGVNWIMPTDPVNDDLPPPMGVRSQFNPSIAVDQTTGNVAVAWLDPRDDDGGTDGTPNTESKAYVGISSDFGQNFVNTPVAAGFSRADSTFENSEGEYIGVAFHDKYTYVAWADNSDDLGLDEFGIPIPGNNPNPDCDAAVVDVIPCMDIYVPEPGSALQLLAGCVALSGVARLRSRG